MDEDLERRILGFMADPTAGDFGELALDLFAHQYERLADYRSQCDRVGASPGSLANWSDVPAVAATGPRAGDPPSRELLEMALPFLFEEGPISLIVGIDEASSPAASSLFEALVEAAPEGSYLSPRSRPDSRTLRSWLGARQRDRRPVRLIAAETGYRALIDTLERRSLKFRLPPGSRVHLLSTIDEMGSRALSERIASNERRKQAGQWLGLAPEETRRLLLRPGATPLVEAALEPRSFQLPHWVRGARRPAGAVTLLDLASQTVPAHVHAPDGAELTDDRRLVLTES